MPLQLLIEVGILIEVTNMKKSEQIKINNEVLSALLDVDFNKESVINKIRLNKCKAHVDETQNYYILVSYCF